MSFSGGSPAHQKHQPVVVISKISLFNRPKLATAAASVVATSVPRKTDFRVHSFKVLKKFVV